jgi:hypothetical protein
MKKNRFFLPLILMVMAGIALVGCPDDGGGGTTGGGDKIDITFNANNAGYGDPDVAVPLGKFSDDNSEQKKVNIDKGGTVTPPASPSAAGYKFVRWNTNRYDSAQGTVLTAATTHDSATTYWAIYEAESLENDFDLLEEWEFTASDRRTETGTWIWDLTDAQLEAIKAVPNGLLVLHFDATADTASTDRNGWGIGQIGEVDGDYITLTSAQDATKIYEITVEISWVLDALGDGTTLSVMTQSSNKDELVGIDLYAPNDENRTPPDRPRPQEKPDSIPMLYHDLIGEISTTGGSAADPVSGKGNIEGDDIALIKQYADKGVLRFYLTSEQNRTGWNDCGTVGTTVKDTSIQLTGGNGEWLNDIKIADLLTKMGATETTLTFIFVNPYNQCAVLMCELWYPQEGVVIPEKIVELKVDPYNATRNQVMVEGLFAERIWKGDVYTLEVKFTADKDVTGLEAFLLDNSAAQPGYWGVLSASFTAFDPVTADAEVTATIVLTANDWASGGSAAANKLVFQSTRTADGDTTLLFWEWTLTQTTRGEEPAVTLPNLPPLPSNAMLLGEPGFTKINNATQKGWEIAQGTQANAEKLVLNLSAKPAGGMDLIWQPTAGGWNQEGVLEDSGAAKAGISTWNEALLTLTIDLTALGATADFNYNGFIAAATATNLIVGYYSDEVDDLGIRRAYLLNAGSGSSNILYTFGEFNAENSTDGNQPGWGINGHDGKTSTLEYTTLAGAEYLVIECFGGNEGGFGGLSVGLQGEGTSWGSPESELVNSWINFSYTGVYAYIVIKLDQLSSWGAFVGTTDTGSGYVYLKHYPFEELGFSSAYLTGPLTAPGDAVNLLVTGCYLTKVKPE